MTTPKTTPIAATVSIRTSKPIETPIITPRSLPLLQALLLDSYNSGRRELDRMNEIIKGII